MNPSAKAVQIVTTRDPWGCGRMRRVVAGIARTAAALAGVLMVVAGPARGQDVRTDFHVTDGVVYDVAVAGDTLYIGGAFSRVGPATGASVAIDPVTGDPLVTPQVTGLVFAVAPDGSGGWYVGGTFTHVKGVPRSNLAHILSDGTLDPWNPAPSGPVYALARSSGRIYAGGAFVFVGGQFRQFLAEIDSASGLPTTWNPNPDAPVRALAIHGNLVYAGGFFTSIGGASRYSIAALDTAGVATAWNPSVNGNIHALAVGSGVVYAGGDYAFASIDEATGVATPWFPDGMGGVYALAWSAGTLYVGGEFDVVGVDGDPRTNLAQLDADGHATSWHPSVDAPVRALAVGDSAVYVGGDFTVVTTPPSGLPPVPDSQPRSHIAALDLVSAKIAAWDPHAGGPVLALAVDAMSVYAGGYFTIVGGEARNNLAALDIGTGVPTPWNPDADGVVYAVTIRGDTLYAGGGFTSVGGQTRQRVVAIDLPTGLPKAWNPGVNGPVRALMVHGNAMYVGGNFSSAGGQARANLAAIDVGTGAATGWNPGTNQYVYALAEHNGTIYAGGEFSTIGGLSRSGLAAIDAGGYVTPWDPAPERSGGSPGRVWALAASETTLYVGGSFQTIGGASRHGIAEVEIDTSLATGWNPDAGIAGTVYAIETVGGIVYAGGYFDSLGGEPRKTLAALDAATGWAIASWDPEAALYLGGAGQGTSLAIDGGAVFAGGSFDEVGLRPRSGIAAIAMAPEVSSVSPDRGGDDGPVTVTIYGSGFTAGATASLTSSTYEEVFGTQVEVNPDGTELVTTFDLGGASTGLWAAVVRLPDDQKGGRPDAFMVETTAPVDLRVAILGPAQVRPGRRRAFDLVLENLGNTDVGPVPLWITGVPSDGTLELDFVPASPPAEPGEPDWSQVPVVLDGPAGRYATVVLPRLPPGATVRRVYLTVPYTVSAFELGVAIAPPWEDSEAMRGCLVAGGVITAPSCVGTGLDSIAGWLAAHPSLQAVNGAALWGKLVWPCEGVSTLPEAVGKAEKVLGLMRDAVEGPPAFADCEVPLVPRWRDRREIGVVTSVDPNDKLGTGGVGVDRSIGADQLMPYSIRFENLETATAPAQEVKVVDALDPATLNAATVSLGPITFAQRTVNPPPGLRHFTTEVDMRPEASVIVRVEVNVDAATGIVGWNLTSLDPETGLLPEDPQSGFLPPNVSPPEGEGSVLFTVMPKSGLVEGTAISNRATIDFDGVPLLTPQWANLLDTTAPESHIMPLGATQDSASFTVCWQPVGSPPDLRDYSVYVSDDGHSYRAWRLHTTATADTFSGPGGCTYAFYSLARDSSGNLEPVPATPDAQTFSRVGVGDGPALVLALEGAFPNPARAGAAQVWLTLPDALPATLEVFDVAGRRVMRRDVGALGPGRHVVETGAATRTPGLYFLRLTRAGRTLTSRMVAMR